MEMSVFQLMYELLCDDKHFTVFETFKKSFELVFVSLIIVF